jgi:heme-degrading monooxygenase HmoA
MIARIWHGYTTHETADTYEKLLKEEILPSIATRKILGYCGVMLLRTENTGETEFVTIMKFNSMEAVKNFAGIDYETAYVPEKARKLLIRFDSHSQHFEICEALNF